MRTVENNLLNQFLQKERESILEIQDLIEKNTTKSEFISSQHQINQLYTKLMSSKTSPDQKEALIPVIAYCKIHTGDSSRYDHPSSNIIRDELLQKTGLPDSEDAKHIALAWLKQVDYFVTVDWKTILNYNKTGIIEKTLDSISHPQLHFEARPLQIIDANSFLTRLRNELKYMSKKS